MLITKAPTSIPLGILCNYVWDSKEGILLAPSYTNIGKISREFYSASNIYECLQQCESAIAAGGVYLRNIYKRGEENFHCNQGSEFLEASGYDISVRSNSKEGKWHSPP